MTLIVIFNGQMMFSHRQTTTTNFSFLSSAYVKTDTIKISTQTKLHEIA